MSDSMFRIPQRIKPVAQILFDHLLALRGQRLVVLVNRGNRGDGLIHEGGFRLFSHLGLRYTAIRFPEVATGDHLLVFGSGAFSRYFNHMTTQVEIYRSRFKRITVLPATYDLSVPRIRRFVRSLEPERATLFCRERESFEAIRLANPSLHSVHLAPDLAFFFDAEPWKRVGSGEGVLAVFRTDAERADTYSVEADAASDVSAGSDSEPGALLDAIAKFRTIHTDRLHAAIAATLLDKEVVLYEGCYFKNRAVFDFTLRGFGNVRMIHKRDRPRRGRVIAADCLPQARLRLRLRLLSAVRPIIYRWRAWRSHVLGRELVHSPDASDNPPNGLEKQE